jgi:transposase-like protein
VALDHGLNANMVRQWVKASRTAPSANTTPFVPLALPAPSAARAPTLPEEVIRIEVPRTSGAITITWPASHVDRALTLLRELLL